MLRWLSVQVSLSGIRLSSQLTKRRCSERRSRPNRGRAAEAAGLRPVVAAVAADADMRGGRGDDQGIGVASTIARTTVGFCPMRR